MNKLGENDRSRDVLVDRCIDHDLCWQVHRYAQIIIEISEWRTDLDVTFFRNSVVLLVSSTFLLFSTKSVSFTEYVLLDKRTKRKNETNETDSVQRKKRKARRKEGKGKERKGKNERKETERKKERKKKEQGTRIPKPILLLLFSVPSLFLFSPSLSCLFLYFLSFSTSLLRIFLITWPFSYYTSCYVPLSFVSRYCRTYKKNALSGGGA